MTAPRESSHLHYSHTTRRVYLQDKGGIRKRLANGGKRGEGAVDESYDYTLATSEQYQDSSAAHAGTFSNIRSSLDSDYHGQYSRSRQELQDRLIERALQDVSGGRSTPWCVFTAGAMGSGKSRTFEYLVEKGIVPLRGVQILDPDMFKSLLPEWCGYIERDPLSAGLHTRRESGYMLEIAQEHALRERRHLWVDGSLRDGEWYKGEFERIRREHPEYKIAIVHVIASRDVVLQRVRSRAVITGRHVPVDEIDDSIARVPRSVRALAPSCDFLAVVDNSAERPYLVQYCDTEACRLCIDDWDQLSTRLELDDEINPEAVMGECDIADAQWDNLDDAQWAMIARNFEVARRTSNAARSDEWG